MQELTEADKSKIIPEKRPFSLRSTSGSQAELLAALCSLRLSMTDIPWEREKRQGQGATARQAHPSRSSEQIPGKSVQARGGQGEPSMGEAPELP